MNVTEWLDEIDSAKKREKDYRKDGEEINEIYSGEREVPFNILYSNTETLLPALFSQVPRPVISRRFKDEDPAGKIVSEASQRMLEYLLDTDIEDYESYEETVTCATLDGLLPGRGVTSVRYDSDDNVTWETVITDSRKWDRVYFGFAHKWTNVPWIVYEEYLDREECLELFPEVVDKLKFTEGEEKEDKFENEERGKRKTALIYQLWDKANRTIKYLTPQYKDDFLKVEPDPLGLPGFFNCPKPLQFVTKSSDLEPTALYSLYENQAKELNKIQARLNKVIDAIRARGAYNGALGEEIEAIFKEPDNALIATDKSSMLTEGGFDKNIWFLPIGELIAVAQQLMQARESAKRVIYEITGISDIVRGQSMASETLGAQKIKEAWGTMRLKRLQKEVQRYALDIMKIMLEIAIQKFNENSWAKMTGLPYITSAQKEAAKQMVQVAQMNNVNPQEPNVQKAMMVLQKPCWGDILPMMKNQFSRSYRIDIETNSTLDVEATEDKQLVGDFMNAMAQFMNGMGPLIEKGVMPFPAAKSMMLAIVKRYRFGREVEEELKAMQPPQGNPEQEKAMKEFVAQKQKFEKEKQQATEQFKEKENNIKMQQMQLDFDEKLALLKIKHQEDLARARVDMDQTEAESEIKAIMIKQKADIQSMLDKHAARMQKAA